MSGLKNKKLTVAQKMMGNKEGVKPVTASDKKMSKRHIAHRHEIDQMSKNGSSKEEILEKSIHYNKVHSKEHEHELKKDEKELKRLKD